MTQFLIVAGRIGDAPRAMLSPLRRFRLGVLLAASPLAAYAGGDYGSVRIHEDEQNLIDSSKQLHNYFEAHALLYNDDKVLGLVRRIGHATFIAIAVVTPGDKTEQDLAAYVDTLATRTINRMPGSDPNSRLDVAQSDDDVLNEADAVLKR